MRIRRPVAIVLVMSATLLCLAGVANSQETGQKTEESLPPWLPEIHVYFRTFTIYQNDTDFDDTKPLYEDYGQSMGYISTTFRPSVKWTPIEAITLFYELEVGDNFWSRNDPNQGDATGEGHPIFRHKQFWGSVTFPDSKTDIKAGYQYLYDPTHLVLDKYLGAMLVCSAWKSGSASAGIAEIPDTTYEGRDPNQQTFDPDTNGYNPTRNNFENDNFIFFADVEQNVGGATVVKPGVFFRWDKTIVGRTLWFVSPVVDLSWKPSNFLALALDIAAEIGKFENGGIDNHDLDILAGAAQLDLTLNWERIVLQFDALALSPDNDPNNLKDSEFIYSNYCNSPTVILTKNDIQDTYDNIDKRAAAQGAGLLVVDSRITGRVTDGLNVFGVVGYGIVLEDEYLSEGPNLGLEADIGSTLNLYRDMVKFTLLGAALFPGKAAAALSNEIDREATQTFWNIQGAFEISF